MQALRTPAKLAWTACLFVVAVCVAPPARAQSTPVPEPTPVQLQPSNAAATALAPQPSATPLLPASATTTHGPTNSGPIAIVPLDSKDPASAALVTGALEVANGRAMIATNGAITAGTGSTDVTLPHRGVLRVCAATTVKLAADASVPQGEVPGLMMVLDHGAMEASFATGRNSDIVLTPDFRILIGGPGSADVKVRLGQHGDTCVDNAGTNAPYVLVTSVFDGGIYRVQPGQRVMFQHGSIYAVVDQEKEPCGCPAPVRPNSNDFPEAQSAGFAPLSPPGPKGAIPENAPTSATDTFVYKGGEPAQDVATVTTTHATPIPRAHETSAKPAKIKGEKKPGFVSRMGHFFRRLFGAE